MAQCSLNGALRRVGMTTTAVLTARTSRAQTPLIIPVRQLTYKRKSKYIFPRVVPAKFRVAPSTRVDGKYYRPRKSSKGGLAWSNEENIHPLADCPLSEYPQPLPDGGLRYYGFDYYPKDPGMVETIPTEEISPLFMVRKVKHYQGLEWWHKNTLDELELGRDAALSKVVIVKNVPEMNEKLYNIKHLIEITAIKLPDNLPHDANPAYCYLAEDGEFQYDAALAVKDEQLLEPEEMTRLKMNSEIIKTDCRNKWYDAWDMKT